MNSKRYPTNPTDLALLEAFMAPGTEALATFFAEHGVIFGMGDPVDLRSVSPEQWTPLTVVFPTPEMQRYLDSDDVLTDHTVEMMELALEKFYKVTAPWVICAECSGREAKGDLSVDYFYLDCPVS